MKRNRIILATGITVLLISAAVLVVGYRLTRNGDATPAFTAVHAAETPVNAISGQPTTLLIPSLGYDLSIIPGVYDTKTGEWTLTTDKVQYASISVLPNDTAGDTFMYGHYRPEVFATLHTIKDGAQATIMTSNGHSFHYTLSYRKVVNPEDSAGIFTASGPPTLTIQTCTGLFFQNRQFFVFKFDGVS